MSEGATPLTTETPQSSTTTPDSTQSGTVEQAASTTPAPSTSPETEASNPFQLGETSPSEDETTSESPESPEQTESSEAQAFEDFTVPDGWSIEADDLAAFTALAQGMELTQEQAQEVLNLHVASVGAQETAQQQRQQQSDAELHAGWKATLHNHPELGGDNLAQTEANLGMLQEIIPPEGVNLLVGSGLIWHPSLVPMFNAFGAALQEQSPGVGGGPGDGERSRAKSMFANSGHQ